MRRQSKTLRVTVFGGMALCFALLIAALALPVYTPILLAAITIGFVRRYRGRQTSERLHPSSKNSHLVRRTMKWTGLAACVAIVIIWEYSSRRMMVAIPPRSSSTGERYRPDWMMYISDGGYCLEFQHTWIDDQFFNEFGEPLWFARLDPGIGILVHGSFLPKIRRSMTVSNQRQGKLVFAAFQTAIIVPSWLLLIAIALSAARLVWLDRRPAPHHCPCGYDLRGNVSGTCPECGVEVRA